MPARPSFTRRPIRSARSLASSLALATLLLASAVGCGGGKLETGYQYTPLGATSVQRRAYYAGPFSPEARNAMMSVGADDATGDRRGRPGM